MSAPVKRERRERFEALVVEEALTLEDLGQWLAGGRHVPEWCRAKDIPQGRLMTWLMADVKRYEVYLRGLEMQAHVEIAEAKVVADGATPETVGVARLQVDTAFKRAKHHAPQVYGERVVHESGGGALVDAALVSAAGELLRLAREARGPVERVIEAVTDDTDQEAR